MNKIIKSSVIACFFLVLLTCSLTGAHADELDSLLDNEDGGEVDAEPWLEEKPKVSQEEFERRLEAALGEPNRQKRMEKLLGLLDILASSDQIVLDKHSLNRFIGELGDVASDDDLRGYVPRLLDFAGNPQFNLAVRGRMNLGIRLVVLAGGASFEQLAGILRQNEEAADLEWLLPALGRTGGTTALSTLEKYRQDALIIPLNNRQNIRRIPCAAVLACAYTGDEKALNMVLKWYEHDVKNLRRFAFYVQWAKQEGLDPTDAQRLLRYARHRIRQTERLLDYRGEELFPRLIQRAVNNFSVSLSKYLVAQIKSANGGELKTFLPLLDHPSLVVKHEVLRAQLERGGAEIEQPVYTRIRQLARSSSGLDRFFALGRMVSGAIPAKKDTIKTLIQQEPNPEVRRRMGMLRKKRTE